MTILLSERQLTPGFQVWRKEDIGVLILIGIIVTSGSRWVYQVSQDYRYPLDIRDRDKRGINRLLFELNNPIDI